jgi:hypothetical protein
MEWPDNFDEDDAEGFDEVLYAGEELREREEIAVAEFHVAALKAGHALMNLARACQHMAEAFGTYQDNHILSQNEIDVDG